MNGASYQNETAQYSFNRAGIKSGDSVTLGGLTFTANRAISSLELAKAFANLSDKADTGAGVAYGSYSGNLVGYSSGSVLANNEVLFTSSSLKGSNPSDISARAIVKSLEVQDNVLTFTGLGAQLGQAAISLNGAGPFELTVGDTTYSSLGKKTVAGVVSNITSLEDFAPNATIADLRDWINSVVPIARAQATIVQKGVGSYSLEVNAKNSTDHIGMTGLANATSIEENFPVATEDKQVRNQSAIAGTILGNGVGINHYSTGRDAKLTVGGIEYQRSSNAIDDVIKGVTLNLMGSAGTANIKVTLGEDHSEKAITDLADAYNALIKSYTTMTANSANSTTPGTFANSPTTLSFIENIKRRFATGATYNVGTNDANGNPYILSLASLGLDYQLDGTLKYNSVEYLTSQASGLRDKFLKGLRIGYVSSTDNLMAFIKAQSASGGALAQEMAIETTSVNSLTKEQENLQTRLNKIQDNYIAQYSGLNALLFQLNSTSTSLGSALTSLTNMSASK
jgi:flagellar hook-associated protein 2